MAANGPHAARYDRSQPVLVRQPFIARRIHPRFKKGQLPDLPWATRKSSARALHKWRPSGFNQFADMAKQWPVSVKGLAHRLATLCRWAWKKNWGLFTQPFSKSRGAHEARIKSAFELYLIAQFLLVKGEIFSINKDG